MDLPNSCHVVLRHCGYQPCSEAGQRSGLPAHYNKNICQPCSDVAYYNNKCSEGMEVKLPALLANYDRPTEGQTG